MAGGEHRKVTGFSGNEIFCLNKIGYEAGQLCLGNSVVSLGVARGLGAGLSNLAGGEVTEITKLIHDGRQNAYDRMKAEAARAGGVGLAGVSLDIINHANNMEFVAIGSTVRQPESANASIGFSTSADAQELYCQMDCGFKPHGFVFGNVAYSIGVGGSIKGAFRSMKRGEVSQYTEIFNRTRHLALTRLQKEAIKLGANSVIGIQTSIAPVLGAQEMMMIGTASSHPALVNFAKNPVTSDMTNQEMWNMVNLGYLPIRLVLGVSVYSLGLVSGIASGFKSLLGGEVAGLTEVLYEAREKALERIQIDAQKCNADEVVGVKTRVYDMGGGLVEFMVMGTAVRKIEGVKTLHENLPPQAIIQDRETFVDSVQPTMRVNQTSAASARKAQAGPMTIVFTIIIVIFYIIKAFVEHGK